MKTKGRHLIKALAVTAVWAWHWIEERIFLPIWNGLRDGFYAARWFLVGIGWALWAIWVLHDALP